MSSAIQQRTASRARPLVLALTTTPLLTELLRDLLADSALVRAYPGGSADLEGLVRHTQPDLLITDSDEDALELSRVAEELLVPLVQIRLAAHKARVFRERRWAPEPLPIETPTTVRNLLLAELFRAAATNRESQLTPPAYDAHGREH